jgi:hypothetical protein
MLKRMQPDLCVATHFLPAEIIAWLITKGKLRARHAIVVTDYDVHALWLCRAVDRYYVAIPESAEYIARIGVPREKLRITGIPIDPVFAAPVDRSSARRHLKLDAEALAVLVSAGGEGVGPIAAIVRDLLAMQKHWQIVAIAGKSEKTRHRLEELAHTAGTCRADLRVSSPSAAPPKWTNTWRPRTCSSAKPAGLRHRKRWRARCPWLSSNPFPARKNAIPITCWKRAPRSAATTFLRRPGRSALCSMILLG